ncbi:MAG: hypothetical protein Q9195_002997 [Heterodermia aff. obscurata]
MNLKRQTQIAGRGSLILFDPLLVVNIGRRKVFRERFISARLILRSIAEGPSTKSSNCTQSTLYSHISTYGSPTSGDVPAATFSAPPVPPKFAPGWCGMHVTHYQKNEDSGDNAHNPDYAIDVSILDADQKPIQIHDCNNCGTTVHTVALNGAPNEFKTDLPSETLIGLLLSGLRNSPCSHPSAPSK